MRTFVVIPAAGSGVRYGGALPKQYALLAGIPLLVHALQRVQALAPTRTVLALAPGDAHWQPALADGVAGVVAVRCGGATRAATVRNALDWLAREGGCDDDDFVAVHDAARACVPRDALARLAAELRDDAVGGLLAIPVGDTLKRAADAAPRVAATLDRRGLWLAQTPQMFRCGLLRAALAANGAETCTDEAEAMERQGHAPRLVMGSSANIKVTHAADLALATALLARESESAHAAVTFT